MERQLRQFFARPDTWSLGLCNGCQLLAALGTVPGLTSTTTGTAPSQEEQGQAWLAENDSGRFESRFVTVKVGPSSSIFLRGMEGAVMGIWSAHGEGKVQFQDMLVSLKALVLVISIFCLISLLFTYTAITGIGPRARDKTEPGSYSLYRPM